MLLPEISTFNSCPKCPFQEIISLFALQSGESSSGSYLDVQERVLMAIVSALVMLLFGYVAYKQADKQGQWSWKLFGIIMAMVALFLFGFTVPLVSSKTLQENHPGLLLTLLLVGIAVFVTIVILVARKLGKTMIPAAVAERAEQDRSEHP
jgi:uncharacterized membrane-anchored protein